eukprot:TRINITY_DN5726_c0_g1_i1.p1 TRINITY_DN5726_c0_g1~~TRINITY_DN5726_c0_g1_i1.p1  ORF type:complete len:181 (-),score=23.18 TRINITY_DN5726_c0_g1_i1:76-618(-)
MRPLQDEETRIFFEKLAKYIGRNIKFLLEREDEPHVFRVVKNRVYYVPERIMKLACNFSKKQLIGIGVCFGKFTKSGKFRLQVTCLDYIAKYAVYKIWVKPSAELSFLYGNHILKAGIGRLTENTPQYQGVVVYSMSDIPLGFGTTAKSTADCRRLEPGDIACFHQADLGEYLREEESLI